MKPEKILEALDALDDLIVENFAVAPRKVDTSVPNTLMPAREKAAHLRLMIETTRELLVEGRREKVMRWLGFIQGAVWTLGFASIDTLKDMNKPSEGET